MRRLLRLLYLLVQHPLHLHRALVRRGLVQGWIDQFRPFWDRVRPPGLPITDYASYVWLTYHFTARFRERYPAGDHFDDRDAQYARLLSYVHRREVHPLRMLKAAWHLRRCRTVLEYGAGAAPYAHFIKRAWPRQQEVWTSDLPGTLLARYREHAGHHLVTDGLETTWDGLVCTEVFEHLPDPAQTAQQMMRAAPLVCFDYVDDGTSRRIQTLAAFAESGALTGPDTRGLYVWRARAGG